jgi:hypothetical protein
MLSKLLIITPVKYTCLKIDINKHGKKYGNLLKYTRMSILKIYTLLTEFNAFRTRYLPNNEFVENKFGNLSISCQRSKRNRNNFRKLIRRYILPPSCIECNPKI